MSLKARAWISLIAFAIAVALLLFLPAGSIHYWQGWLYLTLFVGASALTTILLFRRDPALLARRMRGGPAAESRPTQRIIMLGASLGFIALLVVPALDYRFGWSRLPTVAIAAGDVLVAVGLYLVFVVYRANTFASATVEVGQDQQLVSTGPYAIVRHPMYASALLYVIGTPLALGSYWGLLVLAEFLPFLIWRLFDEEQLLAEQLPGYPQYQERVRHRLIPFVW